MSNGGTTKDKTSIFSNEAWAESCDAHSAAYRIGGSKKERQNADFSLFCAIFDAGNPDFAIFVYWFFRIVGHPLFPTRFRWGNDYPWIVSNTYSGSQFSKTFMESNRVALNCIQAMSDAIRRQHDAVLERLK